MPRSKAKGRRKATWISGVDRSSELPLRIFERVVFEKIAIGGRAIAAAY